MHRSTRALIYVFVVGLLVLAGSPSAMPRSGPTTDLEAVEAAQRPNIVVIMTDDQRPGTFKTMPVVRKRVRELGRGYRGITPTSLCCPSRIAFLTGNFSHTTGIWHNRPSEQGGWPYFHRSVYESRTLATALSGVGYRTGLIGKYLNAWNRAPASFVPPGWDVFRAFWYETEQGSGRYYNYWLRGTGSPRFYGAEPHDYSTDVTADRAAQFIRNSPTEKPFFLLWTPFGPHLPAKPAPGDRNTWDGRPYRNAAVNEQDVSDKPLFIRRLDPLPTALLDQTRDHTMENLKSIDDGVGRLLDALGPRIRNTVIVYMSDQGLLWGEHRLMTKYLPYKWATEYPLFIRWDGHVQPGSSQRLVPQVDVSATLLQVAGASGAYPIEGRSVLRTDRKEVVIEGVATEIRDLTRPSYCALRTQRYLYVKWTGDGMTELYDYQRDPLELRNVATKARYQDLRLRMRERAETLCKPTPPGFTWD
jgi:arylsulfatase A-like enzyme